MSGRSWLVAGILLLTLSASVAAHLGFRARAHAAGRAALAASSASQHAGAIGGGKELERLRGEVALLHGQMLALHDRMTEQKAPEAAMLKPDPESLVPEAVRERQRAGAQRWKAHMVEVAASFEQEPRDRNFSATKKAAVDRAIQDNPVLQKVAGDVDCRSRTCRVEIRDSKSPDVSKQLPALLHSVGPALRRAQADQVDGGNGRTTTMLYLTNEEPGVPSPGQ
jgi:hypothetical protein